MQDKEKIQSFQEVFGVERQLTPEQEHFAQDGTWIPDARSRHILSAEEFDEILEKGGDTNAHNR